MGVAYKEKCRRCKKNYVLVTARNRYAVCYDCEKTDLEKEITDPDMKKFFDIPEAFYQQNAFLRNIKKSYLRFGKLTERQIEAFKDAVERMKDE